MVKKAMLLTLLVLLTSSAVTSSEGAEPRTLLVRLEMRSSAPDILARQEVLVYRDGHVMSRWREISFGSAPLILVARAQASEAQMTALGSTLKLNRVGTQTGGCFVQTVHAEPGYVQAQVDWFGKEPRRNSFLADSKFPTECGSQIYAIVEAIEDLIASATVLDSRDMEDLIEDIE